MRVGIKEVEYWLDKIKEKGIKKFQLKDLPVELKDRAMLIRAKNLDLINQVGKDTKCVAWWEINDNNGKNNGKGKGKIKTSKYDKYYVKND